MTNTINSQRIVTESKQYFSETIKYIYFNKLKFKQWKGYFNILKAARSLNVPRQDVLNFAEALDLATVMFISNNPEEPVEYNKMKIELKAIIDVCKEIQTSMDNKKFILRPDVRVVQTPAKKQQ